MKHILNLEIFHWSSHKFPGIAKWKIMIISNFQEKLLSKMFMQANPNVSIWIEENNNL